MRKEENRHGNQQYTDIKQLVDQARKKEREGGNPHSAEDLKLDPANGPEIALLFWNTKNAFGAFSDGLVSGYGLLD